MPPRTWWPRCSWWRSGSEARLTAATATLQPGIRPGQWVYWKKEFVNSPVTPLTSSGAIRVWSKADASRVAYRSHGYLKFARCTALSPLGPCDLIGGQAYAAPVTYHKDSVSTPLFPWAAHPVAYRHLSSLPRSPRALDHYLSGLGLGPGRAPTRAFTLIDFLLTTYVMPPRLTAELYRALGDIPGVTIDPHAIDAAGRHGVGFLITAGSTRYEIIINPRTYRLMGDNSPSGGMAILAQARVAGPGVTP